jgi:ribosomal-protein-alanine N-acetyltransferase
MRAVLKTISAQMRPMQERDLDAVMEIEESVYPFPWTRGIFADCLRVGYSCWVLELEQTIVAYAVLSAAAGEAHLLNLCVATEHQRCGHGAHLLNRLLDLARWHHATTLFLEVRPGNQSAINLYQQYEFKVVGRRPNYYPAANGREDALVMARKLAPRDNSVEG